MPRPAHIPQRKTANRTIYARDEQLWRDLVEYSAKHSASVSSIIEDAIREFLARHSD